MWKWGSVVAFVLMVLGLAWMMVRHEVMARSVAAVAVQIAAIALMLAARIAFGRRSFHAAANPTEGGLVTTGPYRWLRHPIYAAILYFVWSTALDHHSWQAIAAATIITAGAVLRMVAEETLLIEKYPGYAAYRARTARVIPFLL
jgi:protein-S-isoprenylcysteine O-methyltransferase Ste14